MITYRLCVKVLFVSLFTLQKLFLFRTRSKTSIFVFLALSYHKQFTLLFFYFLKKAKMSNFGERTYPPLFLFPSSFLLPSSSPLPPPLPPSSHIFAPLSSPPLLPPPPRMHDPPRPPSRTILVADFH